MDRWEPSEVARGGTNGPNAAVSWLFGHNSFRDGDEKGLLESDRENLGRGTKTLTLRLLQGKLYVRGDSKVFRFQNGKSESLFLQRKNPRRIAWTVLYRRQHRKGITEVRT